MIIIKDPPWQQSRNTSLPSTRDKLNAHIKCTIKSGVAKGILAQVKGKDVSGSFNYNKSQTVQSL